jgi:ribosomal protein L15
MPEDYFGKDGLKPKKSRYEIINVGEIERLASGNKEIDLKNFKVLGNGEIKAALTINAHSASSSAIKKIEKAG